MDAPDRSGLARSGVSRSGAGSGATTPTTLRSLMLMVRERILETLALITPGAPIVSPQVVGDPPLVAGATTYRYVLVATTVKGHSAASEEGVTATGQPVLSASLYNRLTWTPVPRATGYDIYRTMGGLTQGRIASIGAASSFVDLGAAGDGSTAPTTNTSGTLGQFWTDHELLGILILGAKDLWRSFIDLHQEHFFTVSPSEAVSLPAQSDRLAGVPSNVHRILLIAASDPTHTLGFTPKDYQSMPFLRALAQAPVAASSGATIFYAVTGAGAPVGAPTIYVAPGVSSDVPIRLVYIPTLGSAFTLDSANPLPGETDAALVAYAVAFALAKDREDRSPDPNWLAVYSTEKNSCLVASSPRQEQAPAVVQGVLDDITGPGLSGWDED